MAVEEGNPPRAGAVPGKFVCCLRGEAWRDEGGEEAGGPADLGGVGVADAAGIGADVEEEEAPEAVAAREGGEGEEREDGGGGEGGLGDEVVGASVGGVGEAEVGECRDGGGE